MISGKKSARRWVSLREAVRRLGVSATTLRRWADAGDITTFVTPGGHRRFDTDSLRALLPGQEARPTMERLGETPERMARVYRRSSAKVKLPWLSDLDPEQRTAFREYGQIIMRDVLAALDAATESDRAGHLAGASAACAKYGVGAAEGGLGAGATVETFLRFRRTFIAELFGLAARRGLETVATTGLIGRAEDALDQLLVATIHGWEASMTAGAAARQGRT